MRRCDVLVVGGGNAALCAAIAARRLGASVLMMERAPKEMRGGNARHSRNMRVMHEAPTSLMPGAYVEDDFWSDLRPVTGDDTDEALGRLLIRESAGIVEWMAANGVRFQETGDGILPPSCKTAFFLGGGMALVNALYATARRLGVEILYDTDVRALSLEDGRVREVALARDGVEASVRARAVVVCSGGFQANFDWIREAWGDRAAHCLVRGTPFAMGSVLRSLLDQGVAPAGDPAHAHIVAVDGRSPTFDGGIVTRLDSIPFGIVVDRHGKRFHDEGADVGPTRYALWGERVAALPGCIAHSIFDAEIEGNFKPSIYPAIRADSVGALAVALGINPAALEATVQDFNAAIRDATRPTEGVTPPKSRLALPLAAPPFGAYPVRPGITSTGLGVRVDERARVLMADGRPSENLFAAGVIMSPNILRGDKYLAGTAMTIGAVFGRIAGREAARHAIH